MICLCQTDLFWILSAFSVVCIVCQCLTLVVYYINQPCNVMAWMLNLWTIGCTCPTSHSVLNYYITHYSWAWGGYAPLLWCMSWLSLLSYVDCKMSIGLCDDCTTCIWQWWVRTIVAYRRQLAWSERRHALNTFVYVSDEPWLCHDDGIIDIGWGQVSLRQKSKTKS